MSKSIHKGIKRKFYSYLLHSEHKSISKKNFYTNINIHLFFKLYFQLIYHLIKKRHKSQQNIVF